MLRFNFHMQINFVWLPMCLMVVMHLNVVKNGVPENLIRFQKYFYFTMGSLQRLHFDYFPALLANYCRINF